MIFRARWIYPVSTPPIENGYLEVAEGKIISIGPWDEFAGERKAAWDLGEVVVLPGLINAHCHLDYTDVAGSIPPTRSFPDWVKTMLSFKAHWIYAEYAQSWLNGAKMCLEAGMTTVVDIEAVPELLPEVWEATPLRIVSLFEMTGVQSGRPAAEIVTETLRRVDDLCGHGRCWSGLSPHAPYSTRPDLLRLASAAAAERGLTISTHLGESLEEFEMFASARGRFYDWIASQRNVADCGFGSPVQHAARNGLLGRNFLAVHGNYLASGDAELLAQSGSHVVHCPKSHDYFEHARFPYEELARAGVKICLGTDSLATARRFRGQPPRLNLWDEMESFARTYPEVSPVEILRMTTVHPAEALRVSGWLGSLMPEAAADFITLQVVGSKDETRVAERIFAQPKVRSVFIAGEEVGTGRIAKD